MPSIYSLNSPPHPFWDFVASLDEGVVPNQAANHSRPNPTTPAADSSHKKNADKQPTVEDEVTAESSSQEKGKDAEAASHPSTQDQQMPFRGRCRRGADESARPEDLGEGFAPCRGGGRGRRGGCGPHRHHPRGEGFDRFAGFHPFGLPDSTPMGGIPFFGGPHRGGPHRGGPYPPHHHRHGPPGGSPNFNLRDFLSNLGATLGIDLTSAAEGIGLDRFIPRNSTATTSLAEGVDFEPRADIFDTPLVYLIHLSLPGAKREDVGVDWDGENSALRIGGVVHRPGVDEEILKLLAVDGRKQEVGVFEKKIHLGTSRDPANIDVAGITAQMTAGVLVVKVPKVEAEPYKKREVPISGASSTPSSPARSEKQALLSETLSAKGKEVAGEMEVDHDDHHESVRDARSETEKGDDMEYDDPEEELPQYIAPGHGNGAAGDSEEEGEYVKIDVK